MYFYLTEQWYQHLSGKLFGVLGKNITWTYIEIHFTLGSLNADILRYTADDLSTTLKLWCKLDENVIQYFSVSFSDISSLKRYPKMLCFVGWNGFTRQNTAYRVASVSMHATASGLSRHTMLSRGNGCHKRETALILWGQRLCWGNIRFQPG